MTRLKTEWIEHMRYSMDDYNRTLKKKIGLDLSSLMQDVLSVDDDALRCARGKNKIAVVPITQGEGIIANFCESIAAIIESMGFDADVTPHSDVDGIYDGHLSGRNILFLADDSRYLAMNTLTGVVSDNNHATALGFIHALSAMMAKHNRDISREKILQIGYGAVGKEAVQILSAYGIDFDIYDKNFHVTEPLSCHKLSNINDIKNYHYILDFTNEGGWLSEKDLNEDVFYASPGVPCSLEQDAANLFEEKSVYDNLEIGTAIMLGQSVF